MPASCFCRMPMICSSMNRILIIIERLPGPPGTPPGTSYCRAKLPRSSAPPVRRNSTRSRTSGKTAARTGSQTASSMAIMPSSLEVSEPAKTCRSATQGKTKQAPATGTCLVRTLEDVQADLRRRAPKPPSTPRPVTRSTPAAGIGTTALCSQVRLSAAIKPRSWSLVPKIA